MVASLVLAAVELNPSTGPAPPPVAATAATTPPLLPRPATVVLDSAPAPCPAAAAPGTLTVCAAAAAAAAAFSTLVVGRALVSPRLSSAMEESSPPCITDPADAGDMAPLGNATPPVIMAAGVGVLAPFGPGASRWL